MAIEVLASRPSSRPSTATTSTLAVQEKSLFVLPAEHQALMDSPELQKMEQFASGMRDFSKRYEQACSYMNSDADKLVQPVNGKPFPEKIKKSTVRSLGQELFLDAQGAGRDFCLTFCEYQKLCQGQYYHALDTLFSISDEPIPVEEYNAILPINTITKAVKNLTEQSTSSVELSDIFLNNILQMQYKSGYIKSHCETLSSAGQKMADEDANELILMEKKIECKARIRQAEADQAAMREVRASNLGMEEYYKKNLEKLKEKKEIAEKQEKDFTYKMYGPFKAIWENDVKLAANKVVRYTHEISEIEEKLRTTTGENNKALLDGCGAKLAEAAAKAAGEIEQYDKTLLLLDERREQLQKCIDTTMRKIAFLTKESGSDSVDHLLDSMDAMKNVGKSSSVLASGGAVVVSSWLKDLNFIGVMLNRMSRGKDLPAQKKAFAALKAFTDNKDNKLCQLLHHARPVISLLDAGPCAPLENARPRMGVLLMGDESPLTPDWAQKPEVLPEFKPILDEVPPVDMAKVAEMTATILEGDQSIATTLAAELDSHVGEDMDPPAGSADATFVDDLAGDFD